MCKRVPQDTQVDTCLEGPPRLTERSLRKLRLPTLAEIASHLVHVFENYVRIIGNVQRGYEDMENRTETPF